MKNEIILYQADELPTHIEVKVDEQNETFWLSLNQMNNMEILKLKPSNKVKIGF